MPPRSIPAVSIEKESTGIPETNVHRWTTKVNLAMIVAAVVFFGITAGVIYHLWQRHEDAKSEPPPAASQMPQKP